MDKSFIPNFNRKENDEGKRSFDDIVFFNDHGDYLVNLLKLKNLKASPKHTHGDVIEEVEASLLSGVSDNRHRDTLVINDSGTIDNWEFPGEGQIQKKIVELSSNDKYKKYPLIDLGTNGRAEIAIIAQRVGVPGVIACDIENQIEQNSLNKCKESKEYKDKNYPLLSLNIDMLELLQQLPPNSCNVSMFAINKNIIQSQEYQKKLLDELFRVVPEDGIVFGNRNIMISVSKEPNSKWKDLGKEKGFYEEYVFKKIVN